MVSETDGSIWILHMFIYKFSRESIFTPWGFVFLGPAGPEGPKGEPFQRHVSLREVIFGEVLNSFYPMTLTTLKQ